MAERRTIEFEKKIPYDDRGERYTIIPPEGTVIVDCYYTKLTWKEAVNIYRKDSHSLKAGKNTWNIISGVAGVFHWAASLVSLISSIAATASEKEEVEKGISDTSVSDDEVKRSWNFMVGYFGKGVIVLPERVKELGFSGGYAPCWYLEKADGTIELIHQAASSIPIYSISEDGTKQFIHKNKDGTEQLIFPSDSNAPGSNMTFETDASEPGSEMTFEPEVIHRSENSNQGQYLNPWSDNAELDTTYSLDATNQLRSYSEDLNSLSTGNSLGNDDNANPLSHLGDNLTYEPGSIKGEFSQTRPQFGSDPRKSKLTLTEEQSAALSEALTENISSGGNLVDLLRIFEAKVAEFGDGAFIGNSNNILRTLYNKLREPENNAFREHILSGEDTLELIDHLLGGDELVPERDTFQNFPGFSEPDLQNLNSLWSENSELSIPDIDPSDPGDDVYNYATSDNSDNIQEPDQPLEVRHRNFSDQVQSTDIWSENSELGSSTIVNSFHQADSGDNSIYPNAADSNPEQDQPLKSSHPNLDGQAQTGDAWNDNYELNPISGLEMYPDTNSDNNPFDDNDDFLADNDDNDGYDGPLPSPFNR